MRSGGRSSAPGCRGPLPRLALPCGRAGARRHRGMAGAAGSGELKDGARSFASQGVRFRRRRVQVSRLCEGPLRSCFPETGPSCTPEPSGQLLVASGLGSLLRGACAPLRLRTQVSAAPPGGSCRARIRLEIAGGSCLEALGLGHGPRAYTATSITSVTGDVLPRHLTLTLQFRSQSIQFNISRIVQAMASV